MGVIQSITAAASRIITVRGKQSGPALTAGSASSSAAWDFYETVPEVGTFGDWVSNAMSGATLYAARRGPDGEILDADDNARASQLVSSLAGGPDGQSVLLGDFGTQLAVAGEAWVVIVPDPTSDNLADDKWYVLSTEEVTVQRGKIKATVNGAEIEITEYDPDVETDAGAPVAFRVWKPSPRRRMLATSPVLRSLTVLEELRLLNAAVAAIARSRITGRGLLLVPSGARFPTQPGQDQAEDSLLDTFIEVASTAIREPESAAATVPIVLEVPGDLIDGVKWLQFTSEFDAMAIQLREEAVRRFATGADVPAEVLLGLGDASHWGAWAITAEALRMGAEPRLALVCNALTTEWLRPMLGDDPEASEWMVWYDTSGLRSSSNKAASALDAHREGLISDEAARRELGFTEADAPNAATAQRQQGATTRRGRNTLPVNETQTTPAETGPTRSRFTAADASAGATLDTFMAEASAALAEAVDGLVWSALLMANRKMMLTPLVPRPQRGSARELASQGTLQFRHPATPDAVVSYGLLGGAWDRVPQVAGRHGVDSLALASALDEYVTALLVSGESHEFDNVPRLLAQVKVNAA